MKTSFDFMSVSRPECSVIKMCLQYALVPTLIFGSLGFAIWGVVNGLSLEFLFAGLVMLTVAIVAAAERSIPFYPEWNMPHGDPLTDFIHTLVSVLIIPFLARGALAGLFYVSTWLLAIKLGQVWPAHWSLAWQVILACLLSEFCSYWIHRLAHENEFLWRLHATHHSSQRLYWLNAARDHPFGATLFYAVEILPLLLLGASPVVIALETLVTSILGLLQHANIDYRLGPLNYIFSLGELHRWHHSRNVEEANHNYGSNFIVFDLLFGSFYFPKRKPPLNPGIDIPDFPQTYVKQLLVPFKWKW